MGQATQGRQTGKAMLTLTCPYNPLGYSVSCVSANQRGTPLPLNDPYHLTVRQSETIPIASGSCTE